MGALILNMSVDKFTNLHIPYIKMLLCIHDVLGKPRITP